MSGHEKIDETRKLDGCTKMDGNQNTSWTYRN